MEKTPKFRWNRLMVPFSGGLVVGFIAAPVIAAVFIFAGEYLLKIEMPTVVALRMFILLLIGAPIGCGFLMAYDEIVAERTEFRRANNRFEHCDYPLDGLLEVSERCPECGAAFKKT